MQQLTQGQKLNERYQIVEQLGSGGFGETYLALDQWQENLRCVVKRLNPEMINPLTLRLFNHEAKTLTRLGKHDQIPQLFAHFQQDEDFYLVQEFIEGHDLTKEIKPGTTWSECDVINFLEDILEILKFVHENNVIHRDIKPANIMRRNSDNKIVLIDFGGIKQVKTQSNSTVLTPVIGTRGYMPDEQFKNQAQLSSDVYALGVMAIEALTGLQALRLSKDVSTGQLLWRDKAVVSDGLADVLDKMVEFHSDKRYQSAGKALEKVKNLSLTVSYWMKYGDNLVVVKDYEQGIAAYEEAIKIKPDCLQAWYNRGIALRELKRYENALASFDKAIKIRPDYVEAWYSRGLLLDELGRYEDAILAFDQVVTIKPYYYQAWYRRGLALNEIKRYYGAIVSFKEVIKLKNDYPEAWFYKGIAFHKTKAYQDAIHAFEQAIKLKPNYQLAIKNRRFAERCLRRQFTVASIINLLIILLPFWAVSLKFFSILLSTAVLSVAVIIFLIYRLF